MAKVKIGNVFPSDEYLLTRCAPTGYGLGVSALKAVDDCDNAVKNGWYLINASAANSPFRNAHGAMRVDVHTTSHIVQTAYSGAFTGKGVVILRRVMFSGVWQEWEYITPLMVVGDEYRTTERWQGKAVYTKLVDCGAMPNSESKIVAHNCAAIMMIRCCGTTNLGTTIPYRWNDSYAAVSADRTNIHLCTSTDFSGQTCMVQLWYTKD